LTWRIWTSLMVAVPFTKRLAFHWVPMVAN